MFRVWGLGFGVQGFRAAYSHVSLGFTPPITKGLGSWVPLSRGPTPTFNPES